MVEISELEKGDHVDVEIDYCGATYTVELYGNPQEEWEEHGVIGGKVRSSARPPEAPNVGMDASIQDLDSIVDVRKQEDRGGFNVTRF